MSDSGASLFRADKQTRNDQFSFKNQDDGSFAAVIAGDNSARVHPFPEMLGPGQKVGDSGTTPFRPELEPTQDIRS